MDNEDLFLLNLERETRDVLFGNTENKYDFINKIFSNSEFSYVLLPYAILFISKAFYGKSYYELSMDYSKKSKKITVFVDKNKRSFFEYFYEEFSSKRGNQHILYFGILLYIVYLIKMNENLNYDFAIKVSEDFVISLSKESLIALKEVVPRYSFNKIGYEDIIEYHEKSKKHNGFYNITSKFSDFVKDKFTLFNLSTFPHQDRAINKIYDAYVSGKDGFVLAHATGSGKTVTVSDSLRRIIEYRKNLGLDTKVLFVSKGEILDKIADEFVYFVKDGIIRNVRSGKELEEIVNQNKYPRYIGISFKLLTDFLSDNPLKVSQEEEQKESDQNVDIEYVGQSEDTEDSYLENDDEFASYYPNVPSSSSDVVKVVRNVRKSAKVKPRISINTDMVIELFENYDVIVVDEAHYIKGGTVINAQANSEVKCKTIPDYPDLTQFGYCYTSKPSKLFAILLFVYLRYLNSNKDLKEIPFYKKKFFITISGTIIPNMPHDAWLLFFMTGVSRESDSRVTKKDLLLDSYTLAKSAGGTQRGNAIEYELYKNTGYSSIIQTIREYGETGNLDVVLDYLYNFANAKGLSFDFKDFIKEAYENGYLDIYTERDAIKDGVLVEPKRRNIEIKVFDHTNQYWKESLKYISENIEIVSQDQFFSNIKQYYLIFNKTKN
ncbi:MAG: DEAD/DEAH box helicase family protein, partial [Candidatus Dojkabacteria bacterium]|nr:DEAD/DEAH box helicase family protein [Candidatus Dojkabacteria bacterium]